MLAHIFIAALVLVTSYKDLNVQYLYWITVEVGMYMLILFHLWTIYVDYGFPWWGHINYNTMLDKAARVMFGILIEVFQCTLLISNSFLHLWYYLHVCNLYLPRWVKVRFKKQLGREKHQNKHGLFLHLLSKCFSPLIVCVLCCYMLVSIPRLCDAV